MKSTMSRIQALPDEISARIRSPKTMRARRRLARARLQVREPTGHLRTAPDFLVIGAQRSGTSSLYKWLGRHPNVVASLRKETEYFSVGDHLGESWYRAHFPLKVTRAIGSRGGSRPWQTFEATPDYLFDPRVPARVERLLPDARFIVLLRRPQDRAVSHYHHSVRLGYEKLPLEEALRAEPDRLAEEWDLLERDPHYDATPFRRFSYLARSRYAEQLERWLAVFDRTRFHVIRSEDLFADPRTEFAAILDFLGLPRWEPPAFANHSYRPLAPSGYADLGPAVEELLDRELTASTARLGDLAGSRIAWPSTPPDDTSRPVSRPDR